MVRRAPIGILLADLDAMFLDDVSVRMFQAGLVQVIDVITMANGRMSASGSMSMCRHLRSFHASAATRAPMKPCRHEAATGPGMSGRRLGPDSNHTFRADGAICGGTENAE
jgi:hypothetical protein